MILGDDSALAPARGAATAGAVDASKGLVASVHPAARMVVPGVVVTFVDRHEHPFIWWAFGMIPLAVAGASLVAEVTKKK